MDISYRRNGNTFAIQRAMAVTADTLVQTKIPDLIQEKNEKKWSESTTNARNLILIDDMH